MTYQANQSCVADVLDYLVTMATTACATSGYTGLIVTDGWAGTYQPQNLVCIGGGPEDDEQNIARRFEVLGMGPKNRLEEFDVRLYIRCWDGGTAVSAVRRRAVTLFNLIEQAVRADQNLGGNISTHYPAEVAEMTLAQTPVEGAKKGRSATIRSAVHVKNRY